MNQIAVELNSVLDNTIAGRLLSKLGRRIYFPKGIIAQSAEAKKNANRANATIGMAYNNKKPMVLSAVADAMPSLTAEETVLYAPTAGIEKAREAWKKELCRKNPSLNADRISMPVAVPGLTAGLAFIGDLFLEEGKTIIAANPAWDNYDLIFNCRVGAELKLIDFFSREKGGLNIDAIKNAMKAEASKGAIRIAFNFPQNPSGYSATKAEAKELVGVVLELANNGTDIMVVCDDAYFGLFYEEDSIKESIFASFADLHENVLAIKIDGPTKEDYVWGMRIGFVTFASRGLDQAAYDALIKKCMGIIRSTVSCSNTSAQTLILKTIAGPRTVDEKAANFKLLEARYREVKKFLAAHPDHPVLKPLPFNSGYFMSFVCEGGCAEKLRQKLLAENGIGTIAFGEEFLRVAFSSLDIEDIEPVYKTIYEAAAVFK